MFPSPLLILHCPNVIQRIKEKISRRKREKRNSNVFQRRGGWSRRCVRTSVTKVHKDLSPSSIHVKRESTEVGVSVPYWCLRHNTLFDRSVLVPGGTK